MVACNSPFVFLFTDDNISNDEKIVAPKSKSCPYSMLKPVLEMIGLEANNGPVGSHSIWKLAATFACLLGILKNNKDTRR